MLDKLCRFKIYIITLLFVIVMLFEYKNSYCSTLNDSDLYCHSDIAMDIDSGSILYGKNDEEKIYPASTTKILTAILTIENLDLNKQITVSNYAVNATPYGSSVMGVKVGEIFTVKDLLYGLMLPSGNDAAIVLAEAVSGDVDEFVNLMNLKLKELKLEKTHFVNPHGFHEDEHYSTAKDMANLLRYCLQNETFKKIISTLEYEIPPTNITPTTRKLRNTSRICDPLYTNIFYQYILGGKTGYTIEANGTFVGYGSKDDKNIIVCAFNGSQNINGNQGRFLDSRTLAQYCFDNYEKKMLIDSSNYHIKIQDKKNKKNYIIGLNDDAIGLVKNDDSLYYDTTLTYNLDTLYLLSTTDETSKNTSIVGTVTIYNIENKKINSFPLYYLESEDIVQIYSLKIEYLFIIIIIVLLLLILLVYSSNKGNSKKRKRY